MKAVEALLGAIRAATLAENGSRRRLKKPLFS
jgi:hypothetical protein